MEDQNKHLMFYMTLPLCDECGWELRDKIRDVVRSFVEVDLETAVDVKKGEEDEGYSFEDIEVP